MSSTQFQSSRVASPIGRPPAPTPALLITTVGGPPNQAVASLASCSTSSIRETSQRSAVASPPLATMPWAVACAEASSTSLHTTRPPRAASSAANAAPIPLPAPVMTAAASWLRLSDDPKIPIVLPRGFLDHVATERFCNERCDVVHGGPGFRAELRQRLEDVHLVRPDLQLAGAARRPNVLR